MCKTKRLSAGRPLSDIVTRQTMYDFWKANSDISNDRRNARHIVKIKPSKLERVVSDLEDSNVTEYAAKGGITFKAQKHIHSLTVRELYKNFKVKHPDLNGAYSLFYNCKPFYVTPASAREMGSCLCSKCLNPHALFSALKRNMKDLPSSLSEYLTSCFECQKDMSINFHKEQCIQGTCTKACSIVNDYGSVGYAWDKMVSFYQFEPSMEMYYNK